MTADTPLRHATRPPAADSTDRQRIEAALRESEARYRAILEAAADAVVIADDRGVIESVNPAAERMFGRPAADVVGRDVGVLLPEPERSAFARALEHDLRAGRADDFGRLREVRGLRADGRVFPAEVFVSVARAGGRALLAAFVRDLTDRKQLEEQLRHAQKMEAVGQLAGGVAHDFNNLLTAVMANLSLLALPEGDPNRELVREIDAAVSRAAELTGQMLGFARRKPLRLGPVDVRAVLGRVAALLRRALGPAIALECPAGPPVWARADAGQLEQVVLNLALNARDAMPHGGRLTLDAEGAGGPVRVRVTDTGVGMDAATRERIFEPFFTTKPHGRGSGLGLAMVYGIVQQHGGRVDCDTAPGRGTTFTVELPAGGPAAPADGPADRPPPAARATTVLVIEDEPMIRNIAERILQMHGHTVLLAEDGLEGVELFGREAGRVGVVVLDLLMPRMDGREALHHLRAINPGVPVILSSGYTGDGLSVDTSLAKVSLLRKPYRPAELAAAVAAALVGVRGEE